MVKAVAFLFHSLPLPHDHIESHCHGDPDMTYPLSLGRVPGYTS